MRITVCVRQGLDGEISPFDACAYEAALCIEGAEVTLLSMGPQKAKELLSKLSRLGARRAILLTDKAFAGADTLATAYTLSLAIKRLAPDLVMCGRQTLIGDTAQTPLMLAELLGCPVISGVMSIEECTNDAISCQTRDEGVKRAQTPALLTVERINTLRFPKLRSKTVEVEEWDAELIGADIARCGLAGSPTRVIKTFENASGKRKCRFIDRNELDDVIKQSLEHTADAAPQDQQEGLQKLNKIFISDESCLPYVNDICNDVERIGQYDVDEICRKILTKKPDAVIFGSDRRSKELSARIAARLSLGLCADCTRLEAVDGDLVMYRPALSGSVIAMIKSTTRPAMATVRTQSADSDSIVVCAGYGVKDSLDSVKALCRELGAGFAASRRLVDNGYAAYSDQVGLTGKTVSPRVYIAIGVSGAVHHIVGMQRSATVIAINPDKNAPIFEYADYGITDEFE